MAATADAAAPPTSPATEVATTAVLTPAAGLQLAALEQAGQLGPTLARAMKPRPTLARRKIPND